MAAIFIALVLFFNWSYADYLEHWHTGNRFWEILCHCAAIAFLLGIGTAQLVLEHLK